MNQKLVTCPICEGKFGRCHRLPIHGTADADGFNCDGCGQFEISRLAYVNWFRQGNNRLTPIQRASLSHAFRIASNGSGTIRVTNGWVENIVQDARLPSPATQAASLIGHIGDCVTKEGKGYLFNPETDIPLVGAFDQAMFNDLLHELTTQGLIKALETVEIANARGDGVLVTQRVGLTLDGWERYENEKRGRFASNYGFLAMEFGHSVLEKLVTEVLRPAVREQIGYDLVEMRDVAQAGVIDNIMRAQIRDAAFVLVDLTHDNPGAYWEAGYAEGLGKPVIYLCAKEKFDANGTHFDTNHCTTVMWSSDDTKTFIDSLVSTLRRSLNLFSRST